MSVTPGYVPMSHRYTCGGSSPYRQGWTLFNLPGGPVYRSTTVYK